jgi:hypothetical protein
VIGILAIMGGVGGGVLFVPLVSSFFPFHQDFVRCAGLLIALAGSLSASPILIRRNMADLRLSIPASLIASAASIFGARLGIALPGSVMQLSMAGLMSFIVVLMIVAKKSEFPDVQFNDVAARFLGLGGALEPSISGGRTSWSVRNTVLGFALFAIVGFLAGMFGLGAGWANVPVFNLVMGVPIRIAVATSNLVIAMSSTTSAWVYINRGALLPLIVVPSVLGMMIGTKVGAHFLGRIKTSTVRVFVISLLSLSALISLSKGLGILR